MKPNVIDLAVIIVILFELWMGMRRGLSGELFRLVGTCILIYLGLSFYQEFGSLIATHSRLEQNPDVALALAFLLIVVGLGVCLALLRMVLTLLVNIKFNEAFDRPAGGVSGILHGCLIALLLVFAVGLWPYETVNQLVRVESYVGKTVFRFAPAVTEKVCSFHLRAQPAAEEPASEPAGNNTSKDLR